MNYQWLSCFFVCIATSTVNHGFLASISENTTVFPRVAGTCSTVLHGIVELDDLFQPFKSNPKLQTFLFPSMLVQIEAIDLVGFGLGEMIFLQEVFFPFLLVFLGRILCTAYKRETGGQRKVECGATRPWNVEPGDFAEGDVPCQHRECGNSQQASLRFIHNLKLILILFGLKESKYLQGHHPFITPRFLLPGFEEFVRTSFCGILRWLKALKKRMVGCDWRMVSTCISSRKSSVTETWKMNLNWWYLHIYSYLFHLQIKIWHDGWVGDLTRFEGTAHEKILSYPWCYEASDGDVGWSTNGTCINTLEGTFLAIWAVGEDWRLTTFSLGVCWLIGKFI